MEIRYCKRKNSSDVCWGAKGSVFFLQCEAGLTFTGMSTRPCVFTQRDFTSLPPHTPIR